MGPDSSSEQECIGNKLSISENDSVYHLRPDFTRVLPKKTSPDYLQYKIIGHSRGIILL